MIADFVAAAAREAGVSVDMIRGPGRRKHVSEARQKAMAAAYATGLYGSPQIGRAFGNRDHTTVLHAVRKAERLGWVDTGAAS